MKLIIDIPDYEYRQIKEIYEKNDIVESTYSYIYHGTPLYDVKAEFIARDKNVKAVRSDNCCFFIVEEVLEILDNIGKAEKDFPQPEDIEPAVNGFADTMNRWGDLVEKGGE